MPWHKAVRPLPPYACVSHERRGWGSEMMHACAVLTVRDLCSGTYRLPISMTNISVEMARF
eukprot:SAG25_NODE_5585_length_641_cov_0.706642_1_plen_60_part_10